MTSINELLDNCSLSFNQIETSLKLSKGILSKVYKGTRNVPKKDEERLRMYLQLSGKPQGDIKKVIADVESAITSPKSIVKKVSVIPEISQNETKPDLSDIEFFIGKSGIKYRLSRELLLDLLERFPEPTKKLQYIPADNTPMPGIFTISHLREPAYWEKPIQDLTEYLHFTEPYEETVNNANKMITEGIRYNTISDYQKQYEDLVVSNGTQIEFQQLADDIKANPLLSPKQITVLLHQMNCIK